MALTPLGSNASITRVARATTTPSAAPVTPAPEERFTPSAAPERDLNRVSSVLRSRLFNIPKEEWLAVGELMGIAPGQGILGQALAAVAQGRPELATDILNLPETACGKDAVALTGGRRQAAEGFEKHYLDLSPFADRNFAQSNQTQSLPWNLGEVVSGQTVAALVRDPEGLGFVELRGLARSLEGSPQEFILDGRQLKREDLVMLAVLPEDRPPSTPAVPRITQVASRPVSATTLETLARAFNDEESLRLLEKAGVKVGQKQNWALGQYLGWAQKGDFSTAEAILQGSWNHLRGKDTLEKIPAIGRMTDEFYAQPGFNESNELFPQDLREAVGKRVSVLRYHRESQELEVLYGTISRAAGSSYGLREFPKEDFNQNSDRLVLLADQVGGPEKADPMTFQVGNAAVPGHWIDDVDHRHYASSRYPIRTYAPAEGGKIASVQFRQLLDSQRKSVYPSQKYVVTPERVADSVNTTGARRRQQLENPAQLETGDRVVPKDASLRPSHFSLFVGEVKDPSGQFALQMAEIGQLEDFQVIVGVDDFKPELEGKANLSQMQVPHGEAWTEDVSEATLGGGQVTPAIFEDKEPAISATIKEGRAQRYGSLDTNLFGTHGMVNDDHLQEFGLARASMTGNARQALSYVEGGNMYTGTRADGRPYSLVGKDSVYMSKVLLERQTGREWSEEEVRSAIAADLGMKPDEVFAIEQPGAFHLDLRLTSLAPGEIVLNDAKAAAEQQIAWMNEALEEAVKAGLATPEEVATRRLFIDHHAGILRDRAEALAPFEEMAAADLEAAGLKVHRVGAAFIDPTDTNRDRTNFFNARHGTNQQGQRYAILMGAEAHEEAYVAKKFLEFSQGTVSRLHFLDPAVTAPTLAMYGGLKCRTKPEGVLANPDEFNFFPLRLS